MNRKKGYERTKFFLLVPNPQFESRFKSESIRHEEQNENDLVKSTKNRQFDGKRGTNQRTNPIARILCQCFQQRASFLSFLPYDRLAAVREQVVNLIPHTRLP